MNLTAQVKKAQIVSEKSSIVSNRFKLTAKKQQIKYVSSIFGMPKLGDFINELIFISNGVIEHGTREDFFRMDKCMATTLVCCVDTITNMKKLLNELGVIDCWNAYERGKVQAHYRINYDSLSEFLLKCEWIGKRLESSKKISVRRERDDLKLWAKGKNENSAVRPNRIQSDPVSIYTNKIINKEVLQEGTLASQLIPEPEKYKEPDSAFGLPVEKEAQNDQLTAGLAQDRTEMLKLQAIIPALFHTEAIREVDRVLYAPGNRSKITKARLNMQGRNIIAEMVHHVTKGILSRKRGKPGNQTAGGALAMMAAGKFNQCQQITNMNRYKLQRTALKSVCLSYQDMEDRQKGRYNANKSKDDLVNTHAQKAWEERMILYAASNKRVLT